MTQKTMSEKNLWQRLPVRWRVIFLFLALVGASYGVRHWFPMMPELRDGQACVEVDELSVESVWETPEEVRAAASVAGKTLPEIPQKTARLNGFYVSKLLPTGQKIKIAYSEFSPKNVEMSAPPPVPAPASAENKSALETAKENGREL